MLEPTLEVLLVDDLGSMRRMERTLLCSLGIKRIREAADGQEALHSLRSQRADLVIADWTMPQMGGLELLRALRSEAALKDIPFLLVSSAATKEQVLEAVRAGVDDYIVKPLSAGVLERKLQHLCKRP
jgi:two-component system, chemotaxis family, chemotaxis protein CheY